MAGSSPGDLCDDAAHESLGKGGPGLRTGQDRQIGHGQSGDRAAEQARGQGAGDGFHLGQFGHFF